MQSQQVIVIIDAQKIHWESQRSSMIATISQNITIDRLLIAVRAYKNALLLQHSDNACQIIIAHGKGERMRLESEAEFVPGNIWRASAQALCRASKQHSKPRILIVQKHTNISEQDAALSVMVAAHSIGVEIDGLALGES